VRFALSGARVFDGEILHDGLSVVVRDGRIEALARPTELGASIEQRTVGGLLAPGFIDVQVNGGGGVLFNAERSVAGIRAIGAAHRCFGTTGFLPTFISDTPVHMAEAIAAAREAVAARVPGVIGIHLEGPFLNPARAGAHDGGMLRRAVADDVKPIADAAAVMPVLLTIAPECVPPEILARFAATGVILSAGHSEADADTANAAFVNGVRGVTHLFNAMPPMSARAPGLAGAALDADDVWCGIIADLQHVAPTMLRIAFMAKGAERVMLVTDAMPVTGTSATSFELGGRRITRSGGRLTTAEGKLAGADLSMASAVRNAVLTIGLPIEAALRMASLTPATFLRLDHERGRIAPGYRADLALLDDDLFAAATWIGGEEEAAR
jgi:N-acetylglucosamine-6-phosphate deacetylase